MKRKTNLKQAKPSSQQPVVSKRTEGYVTQIAPKTISRTRQDIATWKRAMAQADNVDMPKRVLLHKLYKDIMLDALLTSQLEGRINETAYASYTIRKGEIVDEASKALCMSRPWFSDLIKTIVETRWVGTTLEEMLTDKNGLLKPVVIPRQNVIPEKGILLLDETETAGIDFRNVKEYGTWLLEFGRPDDYGLLNKLVPLVLFKRFAISCWSELCEIYGIPPRVMKTNTQDPQMLDRADRMMRDMGAAAWFIIDETEEFEFAKGADTNGDVYSNFIRLCNNEISMLVSGGIIGQDTKNGNESKEKVTVGQLMKLIESDKRLAESELNSVVLPALARIGFLPEGLTITFDPQEDTEELYKRTIGFLQYMEVDPEWVKQKFGVEVTGVKAPAAPTGNFQKAPKD